MIFWGRRSAIIQNFTTDVDPGYKYIEKNRGRVQRYMMETKDFLTNIRFELKNENQGLVPFNGKSIILRLRIKEI